MKLLDRYVMRESLQILAIGTLTVIGVFFGTIEFERVMQLLTSVGLPLNSVLSILALQLPTGAVYCLPAAVLMSTLFVLVRQQHDRELLALQISGVSPWRIFLPFILVGAVSSCLAFVLNDYVAPQARLLSQKLLLLGMYKTHRPFPNKQSIVIPDEAGNALQVLIFGRGEGSVINGFVSLDLTNKDHIAMACAKTGQWSKGGWELREGGFFQLLPSDGSAGTHVKFTATNLAATVGLAERILEPPKSELDKTTAQLSKEIDAYRAAGKTPPAILEFFYYRRFSHPLSCLLLVLAVAPLVSIRRRQRIDLSLLYGAVLVVSFFVMQQIGLSLCENERSNPLVAAWLPSVLLCSMGLLVTALLGRPSGRAVTYYPASPSRSELPSRHKLLSTSRKA